MSLLIRAQELGGSRLAQDYLAGDERLAPFFRGSPFTPLHYHEKLREVQSRFDRPRREAAAAALHPTSPAAAERLRRFVEEGGAVVTTGQQAGLFTGPLYTIYKILTAVRLADALERELGTTVLPVFWTASEDHDWAEVNHTVVVARDERLRRIELAPGDPRQLPMSVRQLDGSVESALDELSQEVAGEEFAGDYLELLRESYSPGTTVADAFRQVVASLFSGFDLLLTDAAEPALKALSAPVLAGEIEAAAENEQHVRRQTERLLSAGYHAQVAPIPGASNLFLHARSGRERLYRSGERWITRESPRSFATADLLRLIRDEPTSFSPNVALRPVVESSVFPVLAYVAGPAEISYFAQLRGLFAAFGVGMPLVYPRLSALLLPRPVERTLTQLGLSAEDLKAPRHELLTRLARGRTPPEVTAALDQLRSATAAGYARLIDAAGAVDPTLLQPLGRNRNSALRTLGASEQKVLRHVKRSDAELNRRLDRARAHLRPADSPQERVLNVFPFLIREGPSLLGALAELVEASWLPRAQADPARARASAMEVPGSGAS